MTTTTAPPGAELLDLPLDQLAPHPDNPRKRFVDIEDLAKSIAGVGILEPLLVLPANDQGVHLIVAGERRWRASKKAKLDLLPCVVCTMTPLDVLEAMLTENLQRSELTPIEEARAYQALVDLDATVASIAKKVGRTQPHVKGRLALLALPPAVLKLIDDAKLTLGAATELLKWADDDDAMAHLVQGVTAADDWQWEDRPAQKVEQYIRARDRARERQALIDKTRAKGHTIFTPTQSYWSPPYGLTMSGPVRLTDTGLTAAQHAKEPCHAVWIDTPHHRGSSTAVSLCTDPKRHTTKAKVAVRSDLQMNPATYATAGRAAPKSKHEREAAAKKAVANDRLRFIRHHLVELKRKPLEPLVSAALYAAVGQETLKAAGKMLAPRIAGEDPDTYKNPPGTDWAAITNKALDDPDHGAAAELAIALAVGEARTAWCSRGPEISELLLYLARSGYELSGVELKLLKADNREDDLPGDGAVDAAPPAPIEPTDTERRLAELTEQSATLDDGPELDKVNAEIAELLGTTTLDAEAG